MHPSDSDIRSDSDLRNSDAIKCLGVPQLHELSSWLQKRYMQREVNYAI